MANANPGPTQAIPASKRGLSAAARKTPSSGWTYRFVEITRRPAKAEPRGGTHASPRWHTRLGHWRHLASGKQTWIRACEVGNATRGGSVKDYFVPEGVTP